MGVCLHLTPSFPLHPEPCLRFFFLYMWYLMIGSAYLCVMMFRFLPRLLKPDPDPAGDLSSAFLPLVVFITAGTVSVGLGLMCAWHTLLISRAEGTIEFLDQLFTNPGSRSDLGHSGSNKSGSRVSGSRFGPCHTGSAASLQDLDPADARTRTDQGQRRGSGINPHCRDVVGSRGDGARTVANGLGEQKVRKSASHNPYDLGCVRNWQLAFDVSGSRLWWLAWTLPSRRKLGTGYECPTLLPLRQDHCSDEGPGEA